MNLARQLIDQVDGLLSVTSRPSGAPNFQPMRLRRSIVTAPVLPGQMLIPAAVWDWPDPISGTATNAQFRFADTVPQSDADGALYVPSSRSFSQGYRVFLDCIDATQFPSPKLLARAIQSAAVPTGSPASDPTPPGWTKVTNAGYAQWQPIWDLPNSPSAWMAAVATGSIHNPGSVRIALTEQSSPGSRTPPHLSAQDAHGAALELPAVTFDSVLITAACWGQIPIYPGSWFDPSVLQMGRDCVPDQAAFFGPSGVMACRVAAFYVAWQPSFVIDSTAPVPVNLQQTLAGADSIQAFGVSVSAPMEDASEGLHLKARETDPVIVAVVLEVFKLHPPAII